ncbi:IGF-like family receptor 1 [Orycteropus afer afer]|uniref:IGF-like family receptor 1 n=1 Tax=Orycteropus afer afer TaxID=1230840 RepID=A0A8B7AYN0_ORYAF|nr:IGF-like family receptor 1 [Orycteropus afer afer]
MGPRFLLAAMLLPALGKPLKATRFCGYLEYWNPDNECCGRCLQRFGPPPCPDYEFTKNCGLDDFGNHLTYPFKECPPGQCNPDGAELCKPCGGGAPVAPAPAKSSGGTQKSCRQVPAKMPCPLSYTKPSVLSSQESSSPAISSLPWTSEHRHTPVGDVSLQALPSFVLPLVLVLVVTSSLILLLTVQRHCWRCNGKSMPLPYPGLVGSSRDTPFPLHSTQGSLKASKVGDAQDSLLPHLGTELQTLALEPLSHLLDELEVLEELIILLDPEAGPGGTMACGTTRHLAARYGLPAAWSTFAYSLRPSHSPLRALLEVVVAREPTACLGQFATHLAQLGRGDALQVLSKLR